MAPSKRQTTMAKLQREQAVRDKRKRKQERKEERKRAAAEAKLAGTTEQLGEDGQIEGDAALDGSEVRPFEPEPTESAT